MGHKIVVNSQGERALLLCLAESDLQDIRDAQAAAVLEDGSPGAFIEVGELNVAGDYLSLGIAIFPTKEARDSFEEGFSKRADDRCAGRVANFRADPSTPVVDAEDFVAALRVVKEIIDAKPPRGSELRQQILARLRVAKTYIDRNPITPGVRRVFEQMLWSVETVEALEDLKDVARQTQPGRV